MAQNGYTLHQRSRIHKLGSRAVLFPLSLPRNSCVAARCLECSCLLLLRGHLLCSCRNEQFYRRLCVFGNSVCLAYNRSLDRLNSSGFPFFIGLWIMLIADLCISCAATIACLMQALKPILIPLEWTEVVLCVGSLCAAAFVLKQARNATSPKVWRRWHILWHLMGGIGMAYFIYVEWAIHHGRPRMLVSGQPSKWRITVMYPMNRITLCNGEPCL